MKKQQYRNATGVVGLGILSLLFGCIPVCLGQDTPTEQNGLPLPPCLPIAESVLATLEGSWTVDWEYRTAPGEFAQSVARARIQQDLRGCALVEHFDGTLRGRPFSAITVISRKAEGKFDRVRIDSEHGAFTQSEGHVEDDSLVFEWQRALAERVLRTRHYFSKITPTSFTVEFYLSGDDGVSWQLVQRAQYRSRPTPPQ